MTNDQVPGELLILNGIDAETGTYLTPPLPLSDVAGVLRGGPQPTGSRDLRRRRHQDEAHFGVAYGADPQDLASAGWGVVLPQGLDPAIVEAVEPLVDLRREQAGERFKRLVVHPGEAKDGFLARYGMGPSVADPRRVPYYLLLVGDPELLSFEFQYQLGVSYAVGRLDLQTPEDYASYASTVVSSERASAVAIAASDAARQQDRALLGATSELGRARTLQLFAPRHPGDTPTELSTSLLVKPLRRDLLGMTTAWMVTADVGPPATQVRLLDLITGDGPDILFTAGHGLGGDEAKFGHLSGALVCQNWPGPLEHRGPISDAHYVGAAHLTTGRPVRPRVIFSFACFGAGTPRLSDYPGAHNGGRSKQADRSFTAPLPQRLLSEPTGGALAFIGHVDRAWTCSFMWKGLNAQVTAFGSTLLALMDGIRLGSAMESITSRYAEVATELTHRLEESRKYGKRISDADLVGLWTATHDARGYIVLGDPAVQAAPRGAADLGRR